MPYRTLLPGPKLLAPSAARGLVAMMLVCAAAAPVLAHVTFNVAGVLVWVGLIDQLAYAVTWLSPSYPELEGAARAAAEVPRQIANAHTAFNVANTILFIGFTTQIARLVERIVPERLPKVDIIVEPKYLDTAVTDTPSLALDRVRLELGHMGEITCSMYEEISPALLKGDREHLRIIAKRDDQVDILNDSILDYLQELRRGELTEKQSAEFVNLLSATDTLESLADVIETDVIEIGNEFLDKQIKPSPTMEALLDEFYNAVGRAVRLAVAAVSENNQRAAQDLHAMKGDIKELANRALARKASRMGEEAHENLDEVRLEISVVDKLRRIYTLAKRMAKTVLPEEISAKE